MNIDSTLLLLLAELKQALEEEKRKVNLLERELERTQEDSPAEKGE